MDTNKKLETTISFTENRLNAAREDLKKALVWLQVETQRLIKNIDENESVGLLGQLQNTHSLFYLAGRVRELEEAVTTLKFVEDKQA